VGEVQSCLSLSSFSTSAQLSGHVNIYYTTMEDEEIARKKIADERLWEEGQERKRKEKRGRDIVPEPKADESKKRKAADNDDDDDKEGEVSACAEAQGYRRRR
jgi:hypothetical protein